MHLVILMYDDTRTCKPPKNDVLYFGASL